MFQMFTNCTCAAGGQVSPGLCEFDSCGSHTLWLFMTLNFIGTILGTSHMMPIFVYNIRQAILLSYLCWHTLISFLGLYMAV